MGSHRVPPAPVVVLALIALGLPSCRNEAKSPRGKTPTTQSETTIQPAGTPQPASENEWPPGRPYIVRRASGPISIDGQDHPDQWARAMVIDVFFVPVTHEPPKSRTVARMLWDDQHLYVNVLAHDADLRGTLKGQFARLWTEDVVELFLKPPAPGGGYYEFEMSPTNALLDLEIPLGRHTSYRQRARWESNSRLAVGVKGTIEKPQDTDEYYRVVMAIPWKNLAFGGGRPPRVGEKWKFLFARCDLSKAHGNRQELSTCAPLYKVDFHAYKQYPQMQFAE